MPYSLADVFVDALTIDNNIPGITTPQGLRLANEVHHELTAEFKISTSEQTQVLDGINREFVQNENFLGIWDCDYFFSANSAPFGLDETSVEELNAESKGWRQPFKAVPGKYYWDVKQGTVLGFDFIPGVATSPADSTGFPIVRYTVSEFIALTASSNLPAVLKSSRVYVTGIAAKWGTLRNRPGKDDRINDYEYEKRMLESYLVSSQKANPPKINPFFVGGTATR